MRKIFLKTIIGGVLLATPALAQERAATPGETVLNISATEHGEVPQDLLTASLSIEKQGTEARTVQAEINEVMAQGLAKAKAVGDVEVSTGQYNVYPVDPDPNAKLKTPRIWQGTQTLILKGTQSEALLTLAGTLQDLGLTMQDLSYSVSPQKEEDARDALMEAALTTLRNKAARAAKALGKSHVDFEEVNVDAAASPPIIHPMMMRAMAMAAAAPLPAPTAEAGKTAIDLTVTAKALLTP